MNRLSTHLVRENVSFGGVRRMFFQGPPESFRGPVVCIVGAGPAGFYAAQHIVKTLPNACIDMIDKSPVPFGLVR